MKKSECIHDWHWAGKSHADYAYRGAPWHERCTKCRAERDLWWDRDLRVFLEEAKQVTGHKEPGWIVTYKNDGHITIDLSTKCVEDACNKAPIKHKIVDGPENRLEELHRDLDDWLYNASHLEEIEARMVRVPCKPK